MKAAKVVYMIMNIIMIIACITLATIGMINGFSLLYIIAPIVVVALFLVMLLRKAKEPIKKLMQMVLSAHIAVIVAITQGLFVFDVKIGNAIVIIIIAVLLIAFMVFSIIRMFKKLTELEQPQEKKIEQ